jgi:DNA-binding transcriptional MerR regulator
MTQPSSGWMTIENLSQHSGVTTRNIRSYQSRGLLPPPLSRPGTRSGFYTREHLARLRLVSRLQERGFSLASISNLLEALAAGKSIEQVLGIESALIASEEEQSRVVSEAELKALLPQDVDRDAMMARLLAVGLVDRHARQYRIRHAQVFELGIEAVRASVSLDALLDEFVQLRADLHQIAFRFVALFAGNVLRPFVEAGLPKDEVPEILERMEQLRRLAVATTDALMRQAIADEIESVVRENLPNETP